MSLTLRHDRVADKNVQWTFLSADAPRRRRGDGLLRINKKPRIEQGLVCLVLAFDLVAGAGFEPTTFRL